MKFLSFAFGIAASVYLLVIGDFTGAIGIWMAVGIWLYIWCAVVDAARRVTDSFSGDTYNLTQNKYDLSESDDPTRPNENIPAIIEIGKHYRRKGG